MNLLFLKLRLLFGKSRGYKAGSKEVITLTSIVVAIFCVTIVLILLLSIDMSRYSALMNETGKIRGGIQRLVKLELNKIQDQALLARIDNLIVESKKLDERRILKISSNEGYSTLLEVLDSKWESLKGEIIDYRRGKASSEILIKDSEALWVVSDDVVSSMEKISHFNVVLYYILAIISSFGVLSLFMVLFITKRYIRGKIEYLAQHDQLTGLANRHYFNDVFEREYAIAVRSGRQFALLLCDIDHFKSVNDEYGHDVGDTVLVEIAKGIKSESRESDVVARFGGEEFIILSVETQEESALAFAERIRKSIEGKLFIHDHPVTISIGATLFRKGRSMDELVREADRALYKAKAEGRNRVVMSG